MESQVKTESPNSIIPARIVKNAIRSAICIDDNYAAPYRNSEDLDLDSEQPEKLYYSFRKDGKCDLDIYRFQGINEWNNHNDLIRNKDLMVLDWELAPKSTPKFEDTLKIIKQNIENKSVPFVVIYTQTESLDDVSKILIQKFNKYTETDYDKLINLFFKEFEDYIDEEDSLELFLEENSNFFFEFLKSPSKRGDLYLEFKNKFFEKFQIQEKFLTAHNENCKEVPEKHRNKCINKGKEKFERNCFQTFEEKILKIGNNFQELDNYSAAFAQIAHITLCNETKEGKLLNVENNRIDIDKQCYSLDGIIVLILHKEDGDNGVSPENLFTVFSEAITSNPHNLIHLISLELKDTFRNDFSTIGTNFNKVDEKAFLHHAKNYEEDGVLDLNSFKSFVVKSWIHELLQYNLNLNLDSFDLIPELLEKYDSPESQEFYKALGKYAAMVSCVNLKYRKNFKLGFGNLFKSGEHYFLCITPHCDCLRPHKIDNQFYFIRGIKSEKIQSALIKAETDNYSFCMDEDQPIAIEWICKPFTSFFSTEKNAEEKKSLTFQEKIFPLEFICTIKDNYAQRISNFSFGHGFTVGIDLPHLKD